MELIKKSLLSAVLLAVFMTASPTMAAIVVDRAALNTLLGANQTVEGFESFTTVNQKQLASTQALNATTNWANQGAGKVAVGITFSAGGSDLFLNSNGYYGLTTHTLGDSAAGRPIDITFTAPVTGFGLDLAGYSGYNASGTINVYDRHGVLIDSAQVAGGYNGATSFFGFANTAGIGSVSISSPGGYIMIDNVGFGVASVPEVATWAMMLVGFGLTGGAIRYRRRTSMVANA